MRIDDENKVVWCSESEMSWYTSFNLSVGDSAFLKLRRINSLSTEKEVWLPNQMSIADRIEVIRAISDNYEFKLEQPKEYYWCLSLIHVVEPLYLITDIHSGSYAVDNVDDMELARKLSEQQARDLLKDDFDKFEKVECE